MTKLSELHKHLLIDAARTNGLSVDSILGQIGEHLTKAELEAIGDFLKWLVDNKKTYGYNVGEVYQEYRKTAKPAKHLTLSGRSVVLDIDRQTGETNPDTSDSDLQSFEAWWSTVRGDFSSVASSAKHAAWLSWQAALNEVRGGAL